MSEDAERARILAHLDCVARDWGITPLSEAARRAPLAKLRRLFNKCFQDADDILGWQQGGVS